MAISVPVSTTTTPSSASGNTLCRRVLNYVTMISDPEAEGKALEALDSAAARINSRKWNKLFASTTITLTAADADYALPSDFKEPMALLVLDTSSRRVSRLSYNPAKTFFVEHPSDKTNSTPYYYTVDYQSRLLILDRTPATSYVTTNPSLQLWYFRRIASIVKSTATVGLDPEFDWYLVWEARAEMASSVAPQKANYALAMAERRWRTLVRNDTDQMTDWSETYR